MFAPPHSPALLPCPLKLWQGFNMRRPLLLLSLLASLASILRPGPAIATPEPKPWPALTFHQAPAPLSPDAVTEDWPRFLGPQNTPISNETKIRPDFPPTGPPLVWECTKGSGYACPAIADGRLILFHRLAGLETLDCLHPATGQRYWTHTYPVDYKDDFGYSDGPRSNPVIANGKVYTFGITSWLKCLDLFTGKLLWEIDAASRYDIPKYFFGTGSTPLVHHGLVIVNIGGGDQQCVIAFDQNTGAEKWTLRHPWGQSYASPIPAPWHGADRVLVFAGGKSEPSTGGLLILDPATGTLESSLPWRARRYPSVNASSPVLCGPDRVFISHAYQDRDHPQNGGTMLQTDPTGQLSPLWNVPTLGCHWMTPIYHDGHLYAFSGEKERSCELVCHQATTGAQLWHQKFEWTSPGTDGQTLPMSLYRASLLKVGSRFLCLGEWGTLAWLDLTPTSATRAATAQLFTAQQSWTLPALSHGLLYVCQNDDDRLTAAPPRLLCYDLRATP